MTTPHDPTAPPNFWGRDGTGRGHRAATVCRRRHEQSIDEETYPAGDRGFCPKCGADVLAACPGCERRIRGASRSGTLRPGRTPDYGLHQWGFCDGCGEPYPWATRQELIYQLLNLLDAQEISEHDRMAVTEQLQTLQKLDAGEDLKTQGKLWAAVKRQAPGLGTGVGAPILARLISEGILRHMN